MTVALTRTQWAARISKAWESAAKDMLQAIFQIGRNLLAAKGPGPGALEHGEFIAMVESDLPFSRITANKFMRIARDPRLSDDTHVHHLLPPRSGSGPVSRTTRNSGITTPSTSRLGGKSW